MFFKHRKSTFASAQEMSEPPIEEKIALADGIEAAITGDQLAIVGQDLAALPADLSQYASGIQKLDFSWNELT